MLPPMSKEMDGAMQIFPNLTVTPPWLQRQLPLTLHHQLCDYSQFTLPPTMYGTKLQQ